MEIGADFGVPECATTRLGQLMVYDFDYAQRERPCFQSKQLVGGGFRALDPDGEQVRLLLGRTPYAIKDNIALAEVVGGKLEGVSLYTRGLEAQDEVLSLLVEKYGAPLSKKATQTQNRMGATFTSIEGEWVFDDLKVELTGIGASTDTGYIEITSPVGSDSVLRRAALKKSQEPRL